MHNAALAGAAMQYLRWLANNCTLAPPASDVTSGVPDHDRPDRDRSAADRPVLQRPVPVRQRGGFVSLRAFYDDKLAKERAKGRSGSRRSLSTARGFEPIISAATKLATEAAEAGRPVVVCPPIATFSNASAAERHLQEGLALSVELDQHAETALATLRAIIGSPTLVVASGGTWTDPATGAVQPKLHLHWRLTEPTQTPEEHNRLKQARALACDLVGADATCKAVVHPIRLAGSLHRKDPTQPKLVTILEENPDSEIDLGDVLSELEGMAILRDDISPRSPVPVPAADPATDGELLLQCAERIPNPDLEWAAWNRLGMAFWRASNGDEVGLQAFDALSRKSAKYDAAATRARWDHYRTSPPDRIGVGTLVFEARKADPAFRSRRAGPELEAGDGSHDGLALAMGQEWADARYVALWGAWMFWDRQPMAARRVSAAHDPHARVPAPSRRGSRTTTPKLLAQRSRPCRRVVGLARSNPEQAATVEQWDANPFLLERQTMTIDLRTGIQRAPMPADYITKLVAVAPAPAGTPAPLWTAFLERVTDG